MLCKRENEEETMCWEIERISRLVVGMYMLSVGGLCCEDEWFLSNEACCELYADREGIKRDPSERDVIE